MWALLYGSPFSTLPIMGSGSKHTEAMTIILYLLCIMPCIRNVLGTGMEVKVKGTRRSFRRFRNRRTSVNA